jgi:hypothetical protein
MNRGLQINAVCVRKWIKCTKLVREQVKLMSTIQGEKLLIDVVSLFVSFCSGIFLSLTVSQDGLLKYIVTHGGLLWVIFFRLSTKVYLLEKMNEQV